MRITLISSLFILLSCGEKKMAVSHNSNSIELDSNVDYVNQYFNKNRWSFPVFIDTSDSAFKMDISLPIKKDRYTLATNAFEQIKNQLQINNKTAYRLTNAILYKNGNKIYYSILVIKDRDNYLRGNKGAEGYIFIDSNRIMESANRATFLYEHNKLSFLEWDN